MRARAAWCGIFLLLGCASAYGTPAESRASWTTPHVLVISDAGDPNTLNPHFGQSAPVANLSELTMAWLVRWDTHNRPYPELATQIPTRENGGIGADGLTITYHLRKGVRWSDGAPFTADDVAFTTNVINNPANNEAARFTQIAKIEEPDKYTIVYRLKHPYSTFLESFFSSCCANPSILPKHLLAKYSNINHVRYNDLPVGIGPFRFARWDRGKQVVLVANPLYWRGRPKLNKIVYKVVPTRDALLQALSSHEVDMWYQFSGAYLRRIQALSGYTIARQPSYAYNHLDFNLARPALADPAVRTALRLALDRKIIVRDVANGIGIVQDSALPVSAPYYSDLGTTAYDPARANAILDGAGWNRINGGIRSKRGAMLRLTVALGAGQGDTDKEVALVAEQWRRIGVDVRVRHYPSALMFAPAAQGGILYGNDWDVTLFAWAADPMGDFSAIYGCDAFPPAGQNNVRWCNRGAQHAMDALFAHYRQSERTADVRALMQQFVHDVPSIVFAVREDLFAYNRDLKNYHPNNVTPFDNMMDVDI
ncbi:MAG TPA: peptide ABC transporter substrate-binding protein [Candidatus Baltobacteraceae bacterium]|jgi:peptide/nickel transport system substrate-binding protein|nr:peptide ABC transporter substrate-binding protein [Candidatus Baltobacteraceae bacterium]